MNKTLKSLECLHTYSHSEYELITKLWYSMNTQIDVINELIKELEEQKIRCDGLEELIRRL